MNNRKHINFVFSISIVLCLMLVVWGIAAPDSFEKIANAMKHTITIYMGWWYVLLMTVFIGFILWLCFFSKYKNIRLGDDNASPKYSFRTWFAMLFSAGMGIGLVFWGIAEPLNYFSNPLECKAGSDDAMKFAIQKSFLHWGIHPWSNYAVLALALSYFWYRKKKKGLISPILIPIFGEETANGKLGRLVDILAVIATIAGVSTSLGLGAMQINAGLNKLYGIPQNNTVVTIIIIIVTVVFLTSALTGVDKGIKLLSNINVWLFCIIAIICLYIGNTINIINTIIEGTGIYLQNIIENTLSIGAFGNSEWYGSWTVFYWGWWIAWAPFSSVFIARISEGRTIKEFCIGVVMVPTFVSTIWFSIMGRLGMDLGIDIAKEAIKNTSTALFAVLENYPFGSIISLLIVILLCIFFITSADSATFVLGILTSDGNLNPKAWNKIIWGIVLSLMAISLILFTENGLNMLQTISIAGALPFSFIMLCAVIALIKSFSKHKTDDLY